MSGIVESASAQSIQTIGIFRDDPNMPETGSIYGV
jgi:hypothetical protein